MNYKILLGAGLLYISLSACGGSGSDGPQNIPLPPTPIPIPVPTPTPISTPIPISNFDTGEYSRSNGATSSKAISAWQAGATGKGVKIGIIDSGINTNLAEFSGRIDSASRDVVSNRPVMDDSGHGTAVAAVAAASRNDSQSLGIAFNSTIVALRADAVNSCGPNGFDCLYSDISIAAGLDAARVAGVKVINISLGGAGTPGTNLLNAVNRAVDAGIVVVLSAGNDATPNPDAFGLGIARAFPGKIIIAGALDTSTNSIADFSGKAGTGKDFYLAALGTRVLSIDKNGNSSLWTGTSFSAPIISGSVALLAQAFPNLSGEQIIDILFRSADDLGATGIDDVFGRGRLNLEKAFSPIGQLSLAGTSIPVTNYGMSSSLPEAAGDALSGERIDAVVLDGFSRAYAYEFSGAFKVAQKRQPLRQSFSPNARSVGVNAGNLTVSLSVSQPDSFGSRMIKIRFEKSETQRSRFLAGSAIARLDGKTKLAFGIMEGSRSLERDLNATVVKSFLIARDINLENGFAALHGGSFALNRKIGSQMGFTLSAEEGSVLQDSFNFNDRKMPYYMASATLDRKIGRNWLIAGVSMINESQSLLGGQMGDALGIVGNGANSIFIDGELRRDLGYGMNLGITARRGFTSMPSGSVRSSAYALDLSKMRLFLANDRLGMRISQPLRIESGGLNINLPVDYDYATGLATFGSRRLSLSPSAREVNAELNYGTRMGNGWISVNMFIRRYPGHISTASQDAGVAVRSSLAF